MIINFFGEGSFRIQTSGITILTEDLNGKTSNRLKADVFIKTTGGDSGFTAEHIIKGPGEYEIKGVEIKGFPSYTYLIKAEDMTIGYFGDGSLASAGVEILLVNAGGEVKAIRQLQPKIIVAGEKRAGELAKELGVKTEVQDKLTIKKKDLSGPELKLVALKDS